MAGYSGTPLPKKLGIKPGARVALIGAPDGFDAVLGALPDAVSVRRDARATDLDVIVFFTQRRSRLESRFAPLAARLNAAGGLWIAWPKKSSPLPSDLGENEIRAIGLDRGLVDNKVCAIDDDWSGLRFVRRLRDRR